jgi:hypothetical protein
MFAWNFYVLANTTAYNLVNSNCEHFARFFVEGTWKSKQVRAPLLAAKGKGDVICVEREEKRGNNTTPL